MDGVNEALYVTVSRVFQVLSDISSCRDHRSVTSSVTQCLWGDSVSGPCDGQGIEQDQHWMRHTVVSSEPDASYMYTRNHRSQKNGWGS